MAGFIRAEALGTPRGAHFVCFPGMCAAKNRIITVRETEFTLAMQLLQVCRILATSGDRDKAYLQAACVQARAEFRTSDGIQTAEAFAVRYLEYMGEAPQPAAAPVALEVVPQLVAAPVVVAVAALAVPAVEEMAAPNPGEADDQIPAVLAVENAALAAVAEEPAVSVPPPCCPPDTPKADSAAVASDGHDAVPGRSAESPAISVSSAPTPQSVAARGKSLMSSWVVPASDAKDDDVVVVEVPDASAASELSSAAVAPVASAASGPALAGSGADVGACPEAAAQAPEQMELRGLQVQEQMILHARELRKSGRYIGPFAFLAFALLRRKKVYLLMGEHLLDVVQHFAPWAEETMLAQPIRRVGVFCRVMTAKLKDKADVVVVRSVHGDNDLRNGNHWVAATDLPAHMSVDDFPLHEPCRGNVCGTTRQCVAPVRRSTAQQGFLVHVTQSRGDCGIDAMCFWEGRPRTANAFKELRLQLAEIITRNGADHLWQSAFVGCGEFTAGEDAHAPNEKTESKGKASAALAAKAAALYAKTAAGSGGPPTKASQPKPAAELLTAMSKLTGLNIKKDEVLLIRMASSMSSEDAADAQASAALVENTAVTQRLPAHQRRREKDLSIEVRRNLGKVFAAWCCDHALNLTVRLPWGSCAKFWKDMGSASVLPAWQLIRCGRGYLQHRFRIAPRNQRETTQLRKRRCRLSGNCGRPRKAPALRTMLFDWFLNVRGAVKTRLPPAALAAQARAFREEYCKVALRDNVKVDVPRITSEWLQGWRCEYGVSLRTPNKRWKVSRPVLLERLRICWLNVYRVRRLAELCFGISLIIEGFDQKPFHFNESGSNNRKSLHWTGVESVPLKECSSAVRARWSGCTYVSSHPDHFAEYPPLEALFKGGVIVEERLHTTLKTLCAGGEYGQIAWLSVATGPKGSYRREHIMSFLRIHLEEWREGRDWRIIMADVYGPHLDPLIFDFCWSRGYVLLLHGGGTTGVLQVPDTHLHCEISRRYQDLEMADLLQQQREFGHKCPGRTREDCLRDLATTWSSPGLHERAARGHWDNFLSNALDGSEDHRGRGPARELWYELDMASLRAQVIRDVDEEFHAKRLTWNMCPTLIEAFPARGQLDQYIEGQEDEGDPDEIDRQVACWDDRAGTANPVSDAEDADETALAVEQADVAGASASSGDLSAEQQVVLAEEESRIQKLDAMLEDARALGRPRIVNMLEASLHEARQRSRAATHADHQVALALRQKQQEQDEWDGQLKRGAMRRKASALADAQPEPAPAPAIKRKCKFAAKEAQSMRQRRRAAVARVAGADLVREFDAADLGQGRPLGGTQAHGRNRATLFRRVVAKFDCLPAEQMINLDRTWRSMDLSLRHHHGRGWGSRFLADMKNLLRQHEDKKITALPEWIAWHEKRFCARAEVRV